MDIDNIIELYTKKGFGTHKIAQLVISFSWGYKRFHKFTFGKNNLKKKFQNIDLNKSESTIMAELGYDKIWDCGLFKYQLRLS
jgi:hypothetical protein